MRSVKLLFLLVLFLTACTSATPDESVVQQQVTNQLIKDTMGQLFEVKSVTLDRGVLQKNGDYLATVHYTLRFTSDLNGYIAYLFSHTGIEKRADGAALKNEVRNKLAEKYGNPTVGAERSYQDQFTLRREALGWYIQERRDVSAVEPFLAK